MPFTIYFVAATPYPEKALEDRMYFDGVLALGARNEANKWAKRNVFNVYKAEITANLEPLDEEDLVKIDLPEPPAPAEKEHIPIAPAPTPMDTGSLRDVNLKLRNAQDNRGKPRTFPNQKPADITEFFKEIDGEGLGPSTPPKTNKPDTQVPYGPTSTDGVAPNGNNGNSASSQLDRSLQRIYPRDRNQAWKGRRPVPPRRPYSPKPGDRQSFR